MFSVTSTSIRKVILLTSRERTTLGDLSKMVENCNQHLNKIICCLYKSATVKICYSWRSVKGLTLQISAWETLYRGLFVLSPQYIKPNYLVYPLSDAAPRFPQLLTPFIQNLNISSFPDLSGRRFKRCAVWFSCVLSDNCCSYVNVSSTDRWVLNFLIYPVEDSVSLMGLRDTYPFLY